MDPLAALREYGTRLKEVTIADRLASRSVISFGTRYEYNRRKPIELLKRDGSPFSLDALVFLLKYLQNHSRGDVSKYIEQCRENNVDTINHFEHEDLWSFFTGKTETKPECLVRARGTLSFEKQKRPLDVLLTDGPEADAASAVNLRSRSNLLIFPGRDFSKVKRIYEEGHKKCKAGNAAAIQVKQESRPATNLGSSSRLDRGGAKESQQHRDLGISLYPRQAPPPPAPSSAPRPSSHAQHRSSTKQAPRQPAAHGQQKQNPIILVPEAGIGLINISNVQKLLQGYVYQPASSAISAAHTPATCVVVTRDAEPAADGRKRCIQYELWDKAPGDKESAKWERVVAVICRGAMWQFKGYPLQNKNEESLVELFSQICAFYFHLKDDSPPQLMKDKKVNILALERNTRHNDMRVVTDFFRKLDLFLGTKARDESLMKKARVHRIGRVDKVRWK